MAEIPTSDLWVGGLRLDITAADVRAVLGRHGTVHFVHVGRHPNPATPLSYAKVTMGSVAEAEQTLQALDGVPVPQLSGSNELRVRFGRAAAGPSAAAVAVPHHPRQGPARGPHSHNSGGGSGAHASAAAAANGSGGLTTGSRASSVSGGPTEQRASAVQRCGSCGLLESPELVLRRCSACRAIAYCCMLCQHRDWEQRHVGECATLRALSALLAAQPGVAAMLRAALDQPASGIGVAVQSLLATRLAALEEGQLGEQEAAPRPASGQEAGAKAQLAEPTPKGEPQAAPQPAAVPAAAQGAGAAEAAAEAPQEGPPEAPPAAPAQAAMLATAVQAAGLHGQAPAEGELLPGQEETIPAAGNGGTETGPRPLAGEQQEQAEAGLEEQPAGELAPAGLDQAETGEERPAAALEGELPTGQDEPQTNAQGSPPPSGGCEHLKAEDSPDAAANGGGQVAETAAAEAGSGNAAADFDKQPPGHQAI